MTSSAQAPSSCYGGRYGAYRNIALVELLNTMPLDWRPCRIDKRIFGVLKVEHWGRFYVGRKPTAAYQRTLREAERVVEERNERQCGEPAGRRAGRDQP